VPNLPNAIFAILHIHICNIFLQIWVNFLTNLPKMNPTICLNICKPSLTYFTSIHKKWLKMMSKNLSNKTILIKCYKNIKRVCYKFLQANICNFW
jgi:hypothetical protein